MRLARERRADAQAIAREVVRPLSLAFPQRRGNGGGAERLPKRELERLISELEARMRQAAKDLQFEQAALLRDQLYEVRTLLAEEGNLKPWEKMRVIAGMDENEFSSS